MDREEKKSKEIITRETKQQADGLDIEQDLFIPDGYECPITKEIMQDPVIAADGHSYERLAIEAWLRVHHISPMTGLKLVHRTLTPNHNLRKTIEEFIKNRPIFQRIILTEESLSLAIRMLEDDFNQTARKYDATLEHERSQLAKVKEELAQSLSREGLLREINGKLEKELDCERQKSSQSEKSKDKSLSFRSVSPANSLSRSSFFPPANNLSISFDYTEEKSSEEKSGLSKLTSERLLNKIKQSSSTDLDQLTKMKKEGNLSKDEEVILDYLINEYKSIC